MWNTLIELETEPQVKKAILDSCSALVADAVKEFWHEKRGKWTDICSLSLSLSSSADHILPQSCLSFFCLAR